MLKQILKTGFWQMIRRPALPLLNMLGLAAGIAVSILILLYVHVELNYNSWVENHEGLYRVEGQALRSTTGGYGINTVTPLAPTIRENIDEAELALRMGFRNWPIKQDTLINYETITIADQGLFDIFTVDFVSGTAQTAFSNNHSVVLSEAMAAKYFGTGNAIGQTLTVNNIDYIVSGVFKDLPAHTDFNIQIAIQYSDALVPNHASWDNVSLQTYVKLRDGASIADVEEKLAVIVDEHRPFQGPGTSDMREIYRLFLQPFGDIHLGSSDRTSANSIGRYATVYSFLGIAILVLAISVFNYVSLATARAVEREKEFCLRKVSGANYFQIIRHVMIEMAMQTIPAALIGLLIAADLLPYFGSIMGVEYKLGDLFDTSGITIFAISTILLGLVAGFYPALIINKFRPVKFLSGGKSQRANVTRFRTALVFIQFTASIALIIGAVAISRQMAHIQDLDLGFEPSNIVLIRGLDRGVDASRSESFKAQIAKLSGVETVTRSSVVPNDNRVTYEGFYSKFQTPESLIGLRLVATDDDFFTSYQANLISGRQLNTNFADDFVELNNYSPRDGNKNVVINREAVRNLGYESPSAIIGEHITMDLGEGQGADLTIVGVIDDIQFRSARRPMENKIYFHSPNALNVMSVRLVKGMEAQTISDIEAIWQQMYPETPFLLQYMEERIASLYDNENQQLSLFAVFSILAVILSLVGLIGLVSNSIAHRAKEFSIRRVLGASVADNLKLFTWQYLKPVLIANLPAGFVAYYFLNDWLQKYPSRIDMGADLYLIGGGTIVCITVVLVASLVLRAASVPPVKLLKYE
ncbi:ABC transporter permease [Kordiimonas sp. SCSIO 12610]|uniref:ABC transporter permease n=1 Tax=Kordiimonas sp. SCSIO 12610 TaxID=2829597 RepID=UPI00210DC7A5|nr:ABC transporter permease [Kordiimonas sp. SCSIO 12610]UTW56554.1 ABC transporter permease [Kordiimonas sp. SCSIO 12610]